MASLSKSFGRRRLGSRLIAFASALWVGGCVSVQALEPVIIPPAQYRMDNAVPVEFVSPGLVGIRCAQRGVKFLGMPGLNSGACGDGKLITMPNPCLTVTAGWYAATLCHELAHVNGWSADHRGGSYFKRDPDLPPLLQASASPEAIAAAAGNQHKQPEIVVQSAQAEPAFDASDMAPTAQLVVATSVPTAATQTSELSLSALPGLDGLADLAASALSSAVADFDVSAPAVIDAGITPTAQLDSTLAPPVSSDALVSDLQFQSDPPLSSAPASLGG